MQRSVVLSVLLFILTFSSHGQTKLKYISEPAFKVGEKLTYKLRYGFLSAATGTLEVKKSNLRFSNPHSFLLTAQGETSGAFSAFFTVKNFYESYIDGDNYMPYLYTENIREGKYRREEYALFDHNKSTVSGKKGVFESPTEQFFDLVSAYYFSRNLDFTGVRKGDNFKITYFLNDEIAQLGVEYIGLETIKTSLGEVECIKFSPEIKPGRIFKKDSRLYLWVTNDGNRIPVKAQVEILIGSVTMELVSAKGLKYPLGRPVHYSIK